MTTTSNKRIAWNKGLKGRQSWHNVSGLNSGGWNKGMTGIYSEETLESNRKKHLGIAPPNKGKTMSDEQKKKLSLAKLGKKGKQSNAWKGGLTAKHTLIRSSLEGKRWVRAVLERDRFTCKLCDVHGGKLNADHIKSFSQFPELRFELSNGRTLCVPCHKTTDNYCGRANRRVLVSSAQEV